MSQIYTIICY